MLSNHLYFHTPSEPPLFQGDSRDVKNKNMIGFNIYFCITQGKSATFSTVQTGLAVRRLTSSLM